LFLEKQVVQLIPRHSQFFQNVLTRYRRAFTHLGCAADHDDEFADRLQSRPHIRELSEKELLMDLRDFSRHADLAIAEYFLRVFQRCFDTMRRFVEHQGAPDVRDGSEFFAPRIFL